MTISRGTRLGPYEISTQIGAGGMGEVYRATDTNLARDVAIKVLPAGVATDAERLARFGREAKALAALNHPNIAAIYGVEKTGGTTALVMELVEGPTLAERIVTGPVPLDDALAIAAQIAEALEAAHEQGIIHRDLKPANIKVRADGTVKVLDFGLAKAITPMGALAPETPQSATITAPPITQAGLILGTAAYMSPEQARGVAVDHRADIWAFGCVLYEMLSGRMAFGAGTFTETLARVLQGHADLDALPVTTPPAIRRLVRRCLDRSLRNRLQHIGDARADIADVRAGDPALTGVAVSGRAATHPRTVVWASGAMAVAVLAGVVAWLNASRPASEETTSVPVRFDVPRVQSSPPGPDAQTIALSPDGSRLAYATISSLRIRSLDGEDVALPVVGRGPFFSPDSKWVAFFSADGLQRMPVSGGSLDTITREISGTERIFGGSWAPDGTIVVSSGGTLLRVSAEGGQTQVVAAPDTAAGEVRFAWPEFLPDGRSLLFTVLPSSGPAEARIAVIDAVTRQQKTVLQGGHAARYLPSGHLLYVGGGRLQAIAFDAQGLVTSGVPTAVEGVAIAETLGGFNANFDVSGTGTLAYLAPAAPQLRTMAWVDREGSEDPIAAEPMPYVYPRISPDGTRVALDVGGKNRDIWMWHFEREAMTRITEGPTEDLMPAWNSDGTRVFFASDREGGRFRVFSVASDGAGSEVQEFAGPHNYMPVSMTGPGELLTAASGPGTRGGDLVIVTLGANGKARTLLAKEGQEGNSQLSPDRRWIAYQSQESGSDEVYVRSYPDVDRRREQISHGGGVQPLWGKAGSNELFYWDLKGTLKVVALTLTPDLSVRVRRDVPLRDGYETGRPAGAWNYQISPLDGRLLLLKRGPGSEDLAPIKVIVNWSDELKRLVTPP